MSEICTPETLEKELADYKKRLKWESTESSNKSTRIIWLYTVIILLSSFIFYLLGIITPTHNYNVICENTNGLILPNVIPTWGIEKAPIY